MLHNPGKRINDYDIASLFKTAYSSAASLDKGETGFRSTGIYPLNRNAIPEYQYAASLTTDCNVSVMDEAVNPASTTVVRTVVIDQNCDNNDIVFNPPDIGEELIIEIREEVRPRPADYVNSAGDASAFDIPVDAGNLMEDHILAHSAVEDNAALHHDKPPADNIADHCYAGGENRSPASDLDGLSRPVFSISPAGNLPTTSDSLVTMPLPSCADGEQMLCASRQLISSPQSVTKRVRAVDISPYPKCIRSENRQRKSQKAEILTSSPFKNLMQSKELEQQQRKGGRKRKCTEKMKTDVGGQKRGKKVDKDKKTGSN